MSALKIRDNLYSVGVMNPALRIFDIVMTAEYGTTYNSWLIKGEKSILIETVHEEFFDEYFENICSVVDPATIDTLIMHHTEPDHSGAIQRLLEKLPNLTILASAGGKKFIEAQVNRPCNVRAVKEGEVIETGIGPLKFLMAPMLHWPDSMFSWAEEAKTLFSCDFLGTHYCEPRMLDKHIMYPDKYLDAFEYYYQCIFGPFKSHVLHGLSKIEDLPIELVCPCHGPALTDSVRERMADYRRWSTPKPRGERKSVAVLYASAYGYTAQLAKAAAEALAGEYEVSLIDMVTEEVEKSAAAVMEADAVLVGSCTINRDAPARVWQVLSSLDAYAVAFKPAGSFGDYGWTGEAPELIRDRLKGLKMKFAGEPKKVCFRPKEEDLEMMAEYAREVAALIK